MYAVNFDNVDGCDGIPRYHLQYYHIPMVVDQRMIHQECN